MKHAFLENYFMKDHILRSVAVRKEDDEIWLTIIFNPQAYKKEKICTAIGINLIVQETSKTVNITSQGKFNNPIFINGVKKIDIESLMNSSELTLIQIGSIIMKQIIMKNFSSGFLSLVDESLQY